MIDLHKIFKQTWCAFVILLLFNSTTIAQETNFVLSKSSDFSTRDQHFDWSDTLFILVDRPDINSTDLDEMRFRLKAKFGNHGVDGHFTNHLDGRYTAAISLSALDTSSSEWNLGIEIKDNSDHEFHIRVPLRIGAGNGEHNGNRLFEFEGFITGFHLGKIRVRDHWLKIDGRTKIIDKNANSLTLKDLRIGYGVTILAIRLPGGGLFAKIIILHQRLHSGDKFEVRGVITAIDSTNLKVERLTFHVNEETEFRSQEGKLTLDSLDVGMMVELKAVHKDSILLARKVYLIDKEQREEEFDISGPIEILSDTSLTVGGFEFGLDENTQFKGPEHLEFQDDMLQEGTVVEVRGEYRSENRLWAVLVRLEDLPGTEIEEEGIIEALGDGSLIVNGAQFFLKNEPVIVIPHLGQVDFQHLLVGMVIKIHAFQDQDGINWALHIKIRGSRHERVRLAGRIEALTANSLTIHHTTFEVDSTAEITDGEDNPLPFDSLEVGMPVKVKGEHTPDGRLFAYRIKIRERGSAELHWAGHIDSLAERTLTVAGVKFLLSVHTIVRGPNGEELGFADLETGQFVRVLGRRLPDGVILALKIRRQHQHEIDFKMRGEITNVGSDEVGVEGVSFFTTDSTVYWDRNDSLLTLADFSIGDFVHLKAERDSSGSLFLLGMMLVEPAELEGEITDSDSSNGSLDKGNSALFSLLNNLVHIDESTMIVGADNETLDITAIAAGAVVDVRGDLVAEGEMLASTITVLELANSTGFSESNNGAAPVVFVLQQNYPNPFNPSTTIGYRIQTDKSKQVDLRIYNSLGQLVKTLVDAKQAPGSYSVTWNGRNNQGRAVATGIYFTHLKVGKLTQVRRMFLNK